MHSLTCACRSHSCWHKKHPLPCQMLTSGSCWEYLQQKMGQDCRQRHCCSCDTVSSSLQGQTSVRQAHPCTDQHTKYFTKNPFVPQGCHVKSPYFWPSHTTSNPAACHTYCRQLLCPAVTSV